MQAFSIGDNLYEISKPILLAQRVVKVNSCPAEPRYYPAFANCVDPDQLASALLSIKYVNLYQQSG